MTAKAIEDAKDSSEVGLAVPAMDFDGSVIMVFHDAAFANVTDDGMVWLDKALFTDEQLANKEVFSQVCYVVMVAERKVLAGEQGKACIVDWESHTSKRVVRSILLGGYGHGRAVDGRLASIRGP